MLSKTQKVISVTVLLIVLIGAEAYIGTLPEPATPYPPVNEGQNGISILYPPHHTENGSRVMVYNKTVSAITVIGNGSGYLNFTVRVVSGYDDMGTVCVHAILVAYCKLPSNPKPTGFEFTGMSGSPNSALDFLEAYNEGENASTNWSHQTGVDTFSVNSSVFMAKTMAEWDSEYGNSTHTLTLNAVVLGLPKEVKASIEINMVAEGSS